MSKVADRTGETALGATVRRRDFVYRSSVILRCPECGTTSWGVPIEDADSYEQAALEHVCGLDTDGYREALRTRPHLLEWLRRHARDAGIIG